MTDHQEKQILSDADLEAVFGGTATDVVTPTQEISPAALSPIDLEAALMQVQQQRANALETLVKDQIAAMEAKNHQIAVLNDDLSAMWDLWYRMDDKGSMSLDEAKDALKAMGASFDQQSLDSNGDGLIQRIEVDGQIDSLKGQIDSLSNTQQMDMLRLQNLNAQRIKAFEFLEDYMKKMQESGSSSTGSTR